ncbi:MAG: chemotaxis protein CheW [Myxococcota bacterium]
MGRTLLIFRAGTRRCALPASDVAETLRPLPVDPLRGVPDFVLGAALLRGQPVPVIDAARLLAGDAEREAGAESGAGALDDSAAARFVSLRLADGRRVALAVSAVEGLVDGDRFALAALSPMLAAARAGVVDQIGQRDGELLTLLDLARLLPDELRAVEAMPP